jgi:hypothetical protein
MKYRSASTVAFTLALFSATLCIAALVLLLAAAWLALLSPPETLAENWFLAQALASLSLSAYLGGRYLSAALCAWAVPACQPAPTWQYLSWQAGLLLFGLVLCLVTFG